MNKYKCFQCNGFGVLFFRDGSEINCDMCNGTGKMIGNNVIWRLQGEMIKKKRQELGLTLRKFALKNNMDPSNLSKMERGIVKPNSDLIFCD